MRHFELPTSVPEDHHDHHNRINCTVDDFRWQIKSYALPLSLPYLIIAGICFYQLARILYYRHKMFSFQFWFLSLCAVWSAMRALYFILFPVFNWRCWRGIVAIGRFLFWLPYWLQFATFSFLLVFYATVYRAEINNSTHDESLGWNLIVFIGVNVLALIVLLASISLNVANAAVANVFNDVVTVSVGALYLLLACTLSIYGWRISRLLKQRPSFVIPFHPKKLKSWHVLCVSLLVVAIFLSRAIYDVVSICTSAVGVNMTTNDAWKMVLIVVMFLWWDILPAALVAALFFSIPSTRLGGFRASTPVPRTVAALPAIDPLLRSQQPGMFASDSRYDSDDDENTPPPVMGSSYGALGHSGHSPHILAGFPPTHSAFQYTGAHSPSVYGYTSSGAPPPVHAGSINDPSAPVVSSPPAGPTSPKPRPQ